MRMFVPGRNETYMVIIILPSSFQGFHNSKKSGFVEVKMKVHALSTVQMNMFFTFKLNSKRMSRFDPD